MIKPYTYLQMDGETGGQTDIDAQKKNTVTVILYPIKLIDTIVWSLKLGVHSIVEKIKTSTRTFRKYMMDVLL